MVSNVPCSRAINGGTFQVTDSWTNQTVKNPLTLLREHSAIGALHDSRENISPPRRYPSAIGGILRNILEWSANPQVFAELLTWLHGPAGAGKSSIAHTATEELEKQRLLAAAFFFSRACPSNQRNNEGRLVATIAYQLTQYIPVIRPYIETAITNDRAIFGLSLDQQVKYLILGPFQSLRIQRPDLDIGLLPKVIVVDGLDECSNGDAQTQVLETLLRLTTSPQIFPFIVLITSRVEHCIKHWFEGDCVSRITAAVSLQDFPDKDRDIYNFVRDRFREITETHPYRHRLPLHWPPLNAINEIVNNSFGEFVYATVVMGYIRDLRYIPSRRLDSILTLTPASNRDRPYAELDAVYQLILSTAEHLQEIISIIAFDLTIRGCQKHQLSVPHLERFLSFSLPIGVLLADIQAIFTVPLQQPAGEIVDPDQSSPYHYHKSFEDYLTDSTRALPDTYINLESWREHFLVRSSVQAHDVCRSLGLNLDERIDSHEYVPWIWNVHCWYLKTAPPGPTVRREFAKWETVDLSTLFRIVVRLDVTQLLQSIKFSRLPESDVPYLQDRFVCRSLLPLFKEMIEIRMRHHNALPSSEARLISRTLRLYLEVYPRPQSFSARFEKGLQEVKSVINYATSSSNHPVFDFLPSFLCYVPRIPNISFTLKDYSAETLSFLQILGNLPKADKLIQTHSAALEDMLRGSVYSSYLESRIREAPFIRQGRADVYVGLIGRKI